MGKLQLEIQFLKLEIRLGKIAHQRQNDRPACPFPGKQVGLGRFRGSTKFSPQIKFKGELRRGLELIRGEDWRGRSLGIEPPSPGIEPPPPPVNC